MKLTVNLDGMTWGELTTFVDVVRDHGVDDNELVPQEVSRSDETTPVALVANIGQDRNRTVYINHWDRLKYAEAIAEILREQGDARGQLGVLESMRDHLLGAGEYGS